MSTYYAQTDTPGLRGRNDSYRARFDFATDRFGLAAEELLVGEHFAPEVGFVRRTDFSEQFAQGRFSIRPRKSAVVRKLSWIAGVDYITDADRTVVEDRQARGQFTIEFQNGDQSSFEHSVDYELLQEAFRIAPGVVVPAGGYDSRTTRVSYNLGQQRRINGRVSAATGTFYDGTKTEVGYSGRMSAAWIPRFVLEPSVALNWVELPYGEFNATAISTRFIVTPTPRMLLSSLVQYNALAHSLGSSVRLRWEYTPGSELFVVYSDGRDTAVRGVPAVLNRSFALKVTKLFRF
ncbi:MAG: hypothetical protein EXQ50_15305 [Acidobacteria bacterium]|nr:hypothetical protein [Acidobacteriota bacterium]